MKRSRILPMGSISSWGEMRDRFIANFQGTRDRPPATRDLRRIKQQPGETLQKYIHPSTMFISRSPS